MRGKLKRFKSRALFTFVGGVLVINPAFAQDTQGAQSAQSTPGTQSTAPAEEQVASQQSLQDAMEADLPNLVQSILAQPASAMSR